MMPRLLFAFTLFLLCTSASFAVLTAEIGAYSPPHCSYSDGQLYVNIQGGQEPYHIEWSTGDTTFMIYNVPVGTYSVTVTDALDETVFDSFDAVAEPFNRWVDLMPLCPDTTLGEPFEGFVYNTTLTMQQVMGVDPPNLGPDYTAQLYTNDLNPMNQVYHIVPASGSWGAPNSLYYIPFTDALGCAGELSVYVPQLPDFDEAQVLQVEGSCSGGNNGRTRLNIVEGNVGAGYVEERKLVNEAGSQALYLEFLMEETSTQWIYRNLAPGPYAFVQRFGLGASWNPQLDLLADQPQFSGWQCPDTTWLTVDDLGYTCGSLTGKVFIDSDEDCSSDGNEARIPGMVLEIQPGNYYTLTSSVGNYGINLPYGSGYTVTQQTSAFDEHCNGDLPFNIIAGTTTRDQADTSLTGMDASIGVASGAARPGFQLSYAVRIQNLTAADTDAITVSFTLDQELSFLSASITPTTVSGNTIAWELPNQNGFTYSSINIQAQVPPDVTLIGTTLTSTASLTTSATDIAPGNNSFSYAVLVTGSFDPNDKSVQPRDVFLLDADSTLTYTIRFQNTGTDTAFFVVVNDTLPEAVDPATFEVIASSHPFTLDMRGHGVLRFMFPNILLPDSNVNEPGSHGFVSFRVRPRLPLFPGTVISNAADIFFDYNPAIHTNDAVVTAEFSTAVSRVEGQQRVRLFPNPATDVLRLSADGTIAMIRIHAADGRDMMQRSLCARSAILDVSTLPTGPYFLTAIMNDGVIVRERFIKH